MHLGIAINTFVSHSTTTILLAGQHITPADIVQRFFKVWRKHSVSIASDHTILTSYLPKINCMPPTLSLLLDCSVNHTLQGELKALVGTREYMISYLPGSKTASYGKGHATLYGMQDLQS